MGLLFCLCTGVCRVYVGSYRHGYGRAQRVSAVAATLNNLGPGLGEVAVHFADVNDKAKWILIASMLFGRLEIFTLLILLTPTFWRS